MSGVDLTEALVKSKSRSFDLESIFSLNISGMSQKTKHMGRCDQAQRDNDGAVDWAELPRSDCTSPADTAALFVIPSLLHFAQICASCIRV